MPTTHHQAAAGPPTPSMSVSKNASLTLKVRILRQRRPRDKAGKRPTGTPVSYLSARLAVRPHVVSLGTCNHFAISWHVCFTGSLLVTFEGRFEVRGAGDPQDSAFCWFSQEWSSSDFFLYTGYTAPVVKSPWPLCWEEIISPKFSRKAG